MMHAFCSGELIRDPERRTAKSGNAYATALVRCDDALVSVTTFDPELVEKLLELRRGDPLSVAGRLSVSAYTHKDGEPKAGVQVTVTRMMVAPATVTEAKPRTRPKPGVPAPTEAELDDPIPF